MHGLLSLGVRPVPLKRKLCVHAVRCMWSTNALRCRVEVGKEAKSLIEKAAKKVDPFVAEQNEPALKFVAYFQYFESIGEAAPPPALPSWRGSVAAVGSRHHIGIHGFELYPIQGQVLAWAIVLVLIGYYASAKVEIIIDRSYKNAPFTWATMKDRDGDYVAFGYDPQPAIPRLDLMETLQAEMIDEARRRGSRK